MTKITRSIELMPNQIGPKIKDILTFKAADELEDTCNDNNGYIIAVDSYSNLTTGRIQFGTGRVMFKVNLYCLICKPGVGEVIDVIVNEILETLIIATAGPIIIAINKHSSEECNKRGNKPN